jgi:hypothetical protein
MKFIRSLDYFDYRGTTPPDDIIAQVAELARATRKVKTFTIRSDGYQAAAFPDFERSLLALIGYYQNHYSPRRHSFENAAAAVLAAKEAILALDKRDQVALRNVLYNEVNETWADDHEWPRHLVKKVWNRWPDRLLEALSVFTDNNPFPGPANGGRRKGTRTTVSWHLQQFVECLWEAAHLHGGSLSADHKSPNGGSMIKALDLLRPVLPKSLLPQVLPTQTIAIVIKDFKARNGYSPKKRTT